MSESANRELLAAIREGDLERVMNALEAGGDVEAKDAHGIAGLPLRTACFHGNMRIVAALLTCGANPDGPAQEAPLDCLPLRAAMRGGHDEAIEFLIQSGARWPDDLVSQKEEKIDRQTAQATRSTDSEVEEIEISTCFGLDTAALTQDFLAAQVGQEASRRRKPKVSLLNRLLT